MVFCLRREGSVDPMTVCSCSLVLPHRLEREGGSLWQWGRLAVMPLVHGSRPLVGCPSQLPLSPEGQLNVSLTKEMVIRFNLAFLLRSLFAEAVRSLLRLPVTFSDGCDTLLLGFWLCVSGGCLAHSLLTPRQWYPDQLWIWCFQGAIWVAFWGCAVGDVVSGLAEISGDLTGSLYVLWCLVSNGFVLV